MSDTKRTEGAATGLNAEGGCAVDWTWLRGARVEAISNGLDTLTIRFEGGLVFTVRALLWQGKPFLAFDPYAPPAAPPTP